MRSVWLAVIDFMMDQSEDNQPLLDEENEPGKKRNHEAFKNIFDSQPKDPNTLLSSATDRKNTDTFSWGNAERELPSNRPRIDETVETSAAPTTEFTTLTTELAIPTTTTTTMTDLASRTIDSEMEPRKRKEEVGSSKERARARLSMKRSRQKVAQWLQVR